MTLVTNHIATAAHALQAPPTCTVGRLLVQSAYSVSYQRNLDSRVRSGQALIHSNGATSLSPRGMAGAPTEFDIEREQENPVPAYSRCTTLRRFKGGNEREGSGERDRERHEVSTSKRCGGGVRVLYEVCEPVSI